MQLNLLFIVLETPLEWAVSEVFVDSVFAAAGTCMVNMVKQANCRHTIKLTRITLVPIITMVKKQFFRGLRA